MHKTRLKVKKKISWRKNKKRNFHRWGNKDQKIDLKKYFQNQKKYFIFACLSGLPYNSDGAAALRMLENPEKNPRKVCGAECCVQRKD